MPTQYKIETREAQPQRLAVARATAARPELVKTMLALIGTTWDFVRASGIKAGREFLTWIYRMHRMFSLILCILYIHVKNPRS
jgi:hypothetical protein